MRDLLVRRRLRGCCERRDGVQRLARHVEWLTTGRDDAHTRASCQQDRGEAGTGLEQVLAVVEHDEGATVRKRLPEDIVRGSMLGSQPHDLGGVVGHEARFGQRGQAHQVDAVGVVGQGALGQLERETTLAGTAHTGQRQQPRLRECRAELLELPAPPDERGQACRQIVAHARGHQDRVLGKDALLELA